MKIHPEILELFHAYRRNVQTNGTCCPLHRVANAPEQENVSICTCITEISCQMWLLSVPRTSLFLPLQQSEGEARRTTTDHLPVLSRWATGVLEGWAVVKIRLARLDKNAAFIFRRDWWRKPCNGLTTNHITSEFTVAQFYKHIPACKSRRNKQKETVTSWRPVENECGVKLYLWTRKMCLGCVGGGPETSDVL